MSDKPEPPPLSLADQALAGLPAHTNDKARYKGQWGYWVQAEAKFVPCSNPGTAIAYYRQRLAAGDIAVDHNHGTACVGRIKLFAEHAAFRLKVATELAALVEKQNDAYEACDLVTATDIQEVAARLGIELPT